MKNSTQHYDIDLVYLWVDGNDPEWLAKKYSFLGGKPNREGTLKARYANNDELKYSIRSAQKNVPWIRKIFIVTDEQIPEWLNTENHNIEIIDIREILPPEALPCYNSVVIEYFLYKIPGLAARFLYANDDMFFNAKLHPDAFFDADGYPIVRLQRAPFSRQINRIKKVLNIKTNIYRKTIALAASLVEKKFGKYYSGAPHHNVDAYLKSDYQNVVENIFSHTILPTITNHFRTESDVQRIIVLYYALAVKRATLNYVTRKDSCRIRMHNPDFMGFLERYQPMLFCLNDTAKATDNDRMRVKPFLESLFPDKSGFEK